MKLYLSIVAWIVITVGSISWGVYRQHLKSIEPSEPSYAWDYFAIIKKQLNDRSITLAISDQKEESYPSHQSRVIRIRDDQVQGNSVAKYIAEVSSFSNGKKITLRHGFVDLTPSSPQATIISVGSDL